MHTWYVRRYSSRQTSQNECPQSVVTHLLIKLRHSGHLSLASGSSCELVVSFRYFAPFSSYSLWRASAEVVQLLTGSISSFTSLTYSSSEQLCQSEISSLAWLLQSWICSGFQTFFGFSSFGFDCSSFCSLPDLTESLLGLLIADAGICFSGLGADLRQPKQPLIDY